MPMGAVLDRSMTIAEFLDWESSDSLRYQLFDGRPVAMAPGSAYHSALITAVGGEIRNHLKGQSRCMALAEAGITLPNQDRTYFIADIAVSCVPIKPGHAAALQPILIVEVLSPSTEAEDREVKAPAYQTIPSVREIVLIAQDRPAATVIRRAGEAAWETETVTGLDAVLRLDSVELDLPLAELYRGLELGEMS